MADEKCRGVVPGIPACFFRFRRCVFRRRRRGGVEARPPFNFQMRLAPAKIDHLFSTEVMTAQKQAL